MKKLMRLVEEKTAFIQTTNGDKKMVDYTSDQELTSIKNNQDIKSIETGDGKKLKEQANRKYTAEESQAVGKVVGKSLLKVLRAQGDEVVDIRLTGVGLNKFGIKVKYGNDKGHDVFKFTLNPDTQAIHLQLGNEDTELSDFIITQGNQPSITTPALEDKLSDVLKKYTNELPPQTSEPNSPQPEVPLNEITNPELTKYVNRFVGGLASKYDYSTQDAVYAIMSVLKTQGFKGVNEGMTDKEFNDAQQQAALQKHPEKKTIQKIQQLVAKEKQQENQKPDYLDFDKDGNKQEPMKKALKDRKLEEDLDIGHQDDEPGMLKGDVYKIAKNAVELYKTLGAFQGHGEVDFPHWWQSKIVRAADDLQCAKEYLEFETREPAIDAAINTLGEAKGTCCHKCGHVHVKGTSHPTPYLTGQKNCKFRD